MPQTKRIALTEEIVYQPQAKPERDLKRVQELLAQGIVEDVKILGFKSKNKKRVYLEEGIDPRLYDNKPCNIDHPHVNNPNNIDEMRRAVGSPRPFISRFGKFEEPYLVAGDGLFCKRFRFNVKHPLAEAFRGWVESMPEMVGFSPAQFGDTYETGEGEVVERVTEVNSIELCADPATTRGLLENAMCGDGNDPLMEDDEALDDAYGDDDLAADAGGEGESDDAMLDDDSAAAGESDDDAGSSGGIDITPEMFQSITKIAQAFFDKKCDEGAAIGKIKQIFRTHAAIAESVMPNAPEPKNAREAFKLLTRVVTRIKSKPVKTALQMALLENRDLRGKDQAQTKRQKAVALMEAARLPADITGDPAFIDELVDCKDEKRMQSKIDMWRKLFGTSKSKAPRSAGPTPLTEAERKEAEESMRTGGTPPAITDDERKKKIDEFEAKYRQAI